MSKAVIKNLRLPKGRRVIAISDVHGNLPYLKGLLEKIRFCRDDVLIIVGDMLEKGLESLATLRFIMELSAIGNVYALTGNCDNWCSFLDNSYQLMDDHVRHYIMWGRRGWNRGLLPQMCDELGFDVDISTDMNFLRQLLGEKFAAEFAFLRSMPTVIDSERFTFVHGGIPKGDIRNMDAKYFFKNDNFMNQGRRFDKWCIVGHWPVVLYRHGIACANPLMDPESRIISIDGGCVLRRDGQLNALIIPPDGSDSFTYDYYDSLPVRRVKSAQEASPVSDFFCYGSNMVRVLSLGGEYSLCENVLTGYRMEILTRYLDKPQPGEVCPCADCTDYALPLKAGDEISILDHSSRGYMAKHCGSSGWYFGELE